MHYDQLLADFNKVAQSPSRLRLVVPVARSGDPLWAVLRAGYLLRGRPQEPPRIHVDDAARQTLTALEVPEVGPLSPMMGRPERALRV